MRLIDADEIMKRLCAECVNNGSFICISCIAPKIVKNMPAVDAEPMRHGRWECGGICSECGLDNEERKTDFCPNCGARMDGDKK